MTSLKNKIVCITGASSGIGEACAKLFAHHHARLLLIARRQERLAQLATALTQQGMAVHTLALDVRDAAAVNQQLTALPADWQAIEVLINNAGLAAGTDKLQQAQLADWEQMIDTNLKGLLYVTRALVPGMVARKTGHIINIGSIAGREAYSGGSVYCATKHAVYGLTKALRADLLGTGVRVSTVDPGMVETEFSAVRFKGDQARADAVYAGMTPLTAADIADAVYYCASRPPHVNIAEVLILPTDQASVQAVHRRS